MDNLQVDHTTTLTPSDMDIWTTFQVDHMTTSTVAPPFKISLKPEQPQLHSVALLQRLPDGESREAGKANPNPQVQAGRFA